MLEYNNTNTLQNHRPAVSKGRTTTRQQRLEVGVEEEEIEVREGEKRGKKEEEWTEEDKTGEQKGIVKILLKQIKVTY